MADINTADNAWLAGQAQYEKWKERFLQEFYRPVGMIALRALWATLTTEQHNALKAADPKAYAAVEQMIHNG